MAAYFEYYKIFYHVARCGSITAAAEQLSLTQPSVTRAIRNLESQLGAVLFIRSRQGVTMTPEGERLYARVEPACRLLFSAEEELLQLAALEISELHIGVDSGVVRSAWFMQLLRRFREQSPLTQINLEYSTLDYQKRLLSGGMDFCFLSGQAEARMEAGLQRQTLYSYEDIVVVGPDYAEYAGRELLQSELDDLPAVCFGKGDSMDSLSLTLTNALYRHRCDTILAGSMDLQIQLVKAGFGFSLLPRVCVEEDLRTGALLQLRLKNASMTRTVELISPTSHSRNYAVQRFAALIEEMPAV